MLKAEFINCAVQVNGKLRGTVTIPRPSSDLRGDALRDWIVDAILETEDGKSRFGEGGYNVRSARRTIPVDGGKVINFVI
jgi:leucyl-tRNA synthetase